MGPLSKFVWLVSYLFVFLALSFGAKNKNKNHDNEEEKYSFGREPGREADYRGDTKLFQPDEVEQILFSQSSVSSKIRSGLPLTTLARQMMAEGFLRTEPPLEVVEMSPGVFTAIDNRRLVAAQIAGCDVPALVHQGMDKIPTDQSKARFGKEKYYGDGIRYRMKQSKSVDNIPASKYGFSREDVRIRVKTEEEKNEFAMFKSTFIVVVTRKEGKVIRDQRVRTQGQGQSWRSEVEERLSVGRPLPPLKFETTSSDEIESGNDFSIGKFPPLRRKFESSSDLSRQHSFSGRKSFGSLGPSDSTKRQRLDQGTGSGGHRPVSALAPKPAPRPRPSNPRG